MLFRKQCEKQYKHIQNDHCEVCGDEDNLKKILTDRGYITLCEDCFKIQSSPLTPDAQLELCFDTTDTYEVKCTIVRRLISVNFPNSIFKYDINSDTSCMEINIFKNDEYIILTVRQEDTWKEIYRNIKLYINDEYKNAPCVFCNEHIIKPITCKCGCNMCIECYINMYTKGNGIITCTICGYTMGDLTPTILLDACVAEIRAKFG